MLKNRDFSEQMFTQPTHVFPSFGQVTVQKKSDLSRDEEKMCKLCNANISISLPQYVWYLLDLDYRKLEWHYIKIGKEPRLLEQSVEFSISSLLMCIREEIEYNIYTN